MTHKPSIKPVILCGGSGTRLWPLSRERNPKQFIKIIGEHSLFQCSLMRAQQWCPDAKPLIICNDQTRFLAAEQAREIDCECEIMLEPIGRNTAPAIALAALHAEPGAILFVMPADHQLEVDNDFESHLLTAANFAREGHPITFGIQPAGPETGYGYIKQGEKVESDFYHISSFVEKPDLKTAEDCIASGDYCWNSGMFLFHAQSYLDILQQHEPAIFAACLSAIKAQTQDLDFIRIPENKFAQSPDISVDYAVMERVDNAIVLPLSAKWSDVGSWTALSDLNEKDADNNVFIGDVLGVESHSCYVNSADRLVAMVGVKDHIIVDTEDALLVADKAHIQSVKKIVSQLKSQNRIEAKQTQTIYNPWGFHKLIAKGAGFEVREVHVYPGKGIGKQKHQYRSEHWVVTSGEATVMIDEQTHILSAGQSIFVSAKQTHEVLNTKSDVLIFVEVQIGDKLGAEDIERVYR